MNIKVILLGILMLLEASSLLGQVQYPSLSPKGHIVQMVGNTKIQLEYERPSARKRKVFGELVPWNQVWRTGAGHCTKISFDKAVQIGGQKLPAGKYVLLSIPNPDEWIVILNTDTTLYGSYNYDSKKDVARFVAIPKPTHRYYETLNFDIDLIPNNARIYLSWANIEVSFDVHTSTDAEIHQYISDQLLTRKETESDKYAGAAEYLLFQNTNLSDAIQLADYAVELDNKNGWARRLKAEIYEKLQLYENALEVVNQALALVSDTNQLNYWKGYAERLKGKMED